MPIHPAGNSHHDELLWIPSHGRDGSSGGADWQGGGRQRLKLGGLRDVNFGMDRERWSPRRRELPGKGQRDDPSLVHLAGGMGDLDARGGRCRQRVHGDTTVTHVSEVLLVAGRELDQPVDTLGGSRRRDDAVSGRAANAA